MVDGIFEYKTSSEIEHKQILSTIEFDKAQYQENR